MKILIRTLALALAASTLLHAQQALTGTWEGQTPNRQPIVLELAAKGETVTGTMAAGEQKSPIENGKVAKNTVTFSATMGGGTEAFTGELAGNELKIWMDDRGPAAAITLKRAAPAKK
jgi:hypothetical protein